MGSEPQQNTKEVPCIIYFHEGFSPYLPFTLWQAKKSNPEARIILLGDERNRISGIQYEHHLISGYSTKAQEFRKIYQHFHPGNLEDERRCIERWLILADFLRQQNTRDFLFLDSDTLLFENFLSTPPEWNDHDAAGAPLFWNFCFFKKRKLVEDYAAWILKQYHNPSTLNRWRTLFEEGRGFKIQDMALANFFVKETGISVLDVSAPDGGKVVDTGKWGGAFLQGKKRINIVSQRKKGGKIHVLTGQGPIQLRAIHVQGFYKNHVAGLTGWSWPVLKSFFRPNYRKNFKQLFWYGLNGFCYRRYLNKNYQRTVRGAPR